MKRVPLRAVSPKRQATRPSRPRSPQGTLSLALPHVLACEMSVAEAARVHGCDRKSLESAARSACRVATMRRDHWTCQNCGDVAVDVQHRIRRGMGGSSDPRIAFGLANQVAMCRPCHSRAEKRDPEMHALGFWLETTEDPALAPVIVLTRSGRARRWLTADGGWTADAPEGAEAA